MDYSRLHISSFVIILEGKIDGNLEHNIWDWAGELAVFMDPLRMPETLIPFSFSFVQISAAGGLMAWMNPFITTTLYLMSLFSGR